MKIRVRNFKIGAWAGNWISTLAIASGQSVIFLARRYELTGGQIKNAVVSAARAALAKGEKVVTMSDFIRAIDHEVGYQPKRAIGFA